MGVVHTPGANYGWRARIGLLQPGVVSDTNPYEFYMMAPEGVQMVQTSLGIASLSEANYARAIAGLEAPVQRLLPRKPDVLIQTGIPPLVHGGWGVEEELRQRVAKLTSIPYVTDAAGSIAAMKAVKATMPAIRGRRSSAQSASCAPRPVSGRRVVVRASLMSSPPCAGAGRSTGGC